MLLSTPPPQTTQDIAVQEQRLSEKELEKIKKPLFKFNGCLDFSAGKDIDAQNDATLKIGKIAAVNSWSDMTLFGSFYDEIKISLGPELPIHPVLGADFQVGERTTGRLGLSTGFVESGSVRLAIDRYFASNKKDDDGKDNKFWWLRGSYGPFDLPFDLGTLDDDWSVGGMTRLFSDDKTGVNVWVSKDLGKGWGAKVQYWKTPAEKTRIYVTVFKRY